MTYHDQNRRGQWAAGYQGMSVADAPADTRAEFIRKTYLHLVAAVLLLVGIEAALFALVPYETQIGILSALADNRFMWLLVLGGFIVVSMVADRIARSPGGRTVQYSGLLMYVSAQALILFPLLIAARYFFDGAIGSAALVTAIMFAGLTGFAFVTGSNFSWMRGILGVAGLAALALIAAGAIFGFTLGLWFIVPMIGFACCAILYQTSALIHEYQPGQHVAASLALFASVALLFWYVLQLIMSLQRD